MLKFVYRKFDNFWYSIVSEKNVFKWIKHIVSKTISTDNSYWSAHDCSVAPYVQPVQDPYGRVTRMTWPHPGTVRFVSGQVTNREIELGLAVCYRAIAFGGYVFSVSLLYN